MGRAFLNLTFLFIALCSFKLYGASHSGALATYEDNPPIFYAALARASYKQSTLQADRSAQRHSNGKARVLSRKIYRSIVFGNTNFILAKDSKGNLHVAIEGSNSAMNWVGNASMLLRGTVTEYDVPEHTRRAMHKMIKHWEKKHKKPITSISGHSQGGAYASQMVHWKSKHYERTGTQVITFNCLKPMKAKNQLHFLIAKEHAVSLVSPSGRYITIDEGSGHTSIKSNHGMTYFFPAFKGKSWKDVR